MIIRLPFSHKNNINSSVVFNPIMIIVGFTFYNELDMLHVHLEELYNVVDHFIIVEADKTFMCKEKPFFFEVNKARYQKYMDKIVHIKVTDMPNADNPWLNESHQRNCITRGVNQLSASGVETRPSDVLVVVDVDEVCRPGLIEKLPSMFQPLCTTPIALSFTNFQRTFDLVHKQQWKHPRAITLGGLHAGMWTCNELRNTLRVAHITPKDAGWHMGYFMRPEAIVDKLSNFSHTEVNTPEVANVEHINKSLVDGKSLLPGENLFSTTKYPNNLKPKLWRLVSQSITID